jgi:hypothetical protein
MTWRGLTIINVGFTVDTYKKNIYMFYKIAQPNEIIKEYKKFIVTSESRRTFASVACDRVHTVPSIPARTAQTIINVGLTPGARKPNRASTPEAIDQILANTIVQTGVDLTFIYINFTLSSSKT